MATLYKAGKRIDMLLGGAVFFIALTVYLFTVYPSITWWGSAPYTLCALTLGVTSPPGSVILVLLGRLFSFLSFLNSPAFRINLLVALISAGVALIVYTIVVHILRGIESGTNRPFSSFSIPLCGAICAVSFAFTQSVWDKATQANPSYTVSLLFTALLIWVALLWWERADDRGAERCLILIAYLFGMDLSAHRSNILLIPAVLFMVALKRPRIFRSIKPWLLMGLAFLLGASMQFVVMVRSRVDPCIDFGNPDTLTGLWSYFSLKQYGREAFLPNILHRRGPFWAYQVKHMYLRYLRWNFIGGGPDAPPFSLRGLYGIPLLMGLVGFAYQLRRDRKRALFLLGTFLMASLGAILYLNVPKGYFLEIDRLFLSSFLLFALWIGVGCYLLLQKLPELMKNRASACKVTSVVSIILLLAILPLNTFRNNFYRNHMAHNYAAYDYGYNLLQSCEKGAILFTNGENDTWPAWYLQLVEGVRPDVTVMNLMLLNARWYLLQVKKQHPDVLLDLSDEAIRTIRPIEWSAQTMTIVGSESAGKARGDSVIFTLLPTIRNRWLRVQDQAVLRILQENRWRRPIYFATSVPEYNTLGLKDYFRLDGLAWRVVPSPGDQSEVGHLEENLLSRFRYRGFGGEGYIDPTSRAMGGNYKYAFQHLANYYNQRGDKEQGSRILTELHCRLPVLGNAP